MSKIIRNGDFLPLGVAVQLYNNRPKVYFLWGGIKMNSFGLCFGLSKGGKTILIENLLLALAIGRKEFLGLKLPGEAMKVLMIGLEEYWTNRVERNIKQLNSLTVDERKLAETNFIIQPLEFSKYITTNKDWVALVAVIKASDAKVVAIDSITRMNHGNLEESKTAEEIMQRLRDICYELKITLICIHHTPKMLDLPITMDKIKGSAVFAQESDFAIGVNRTSNGYRYQKDVFFRYANDDIEKVREFKIDENTCIVYSGDVYENEILERGDRRRMDEHRDKILEYFEKYNCKEHQIKDLVDVFMSQLSLKERRVRDLLSELVKDNKLENPKRGFYRSTSCEDNKVSDEEE